MIDSTIRKNVAFGYADRGHRDTKVRRHSKARLDEFVRSLPEDWIPALASAASGFPAVSVRESGAEALFEDPEFSFWMKRPAHWITIRAAIGIHQQPAWSPSVIIIAHRLQTIEKM
ncbi:MAG: hypothetical protein ACLURV_14145 [Gallintestinimicrobium sp.]